MQKACSADVLAYLTKQQSLFQNTLFNTLLLV